MKKLLKNQLNIVLKNGSNFTLHEFSESQQRDILDEIEFDKESNIAHEPIYASLNYGKETVPFHIVNNYADIQQYCDNHHLYPGVDFLDDDYKLVYSGISFYNLKPKSFEKTNKMIQTK